MAWQPTPVFLLENPHGQRRLAGYSPWGLKEWDRTEQLSSTTHANIPTLTCNNTGKGFWGKQHKDREMIIPQIRIMIPWGMGKDLIMWLASWVGNREGIRGPEMYGNLYAVHVYYMHFSVYLLYFTTKEQNIKLQSNFWQWVNSQNLYIFLTCGVDIGELPG